MRIDLVIRGLKEYQDREATDVVLFDNTKDPKFDDHTVQEDYFEFRRGDGGKVFLVYKRYSKLNPSRPQMPADRIEPPVSNKKPDTMELSHAFFVSALLIGYLGVSFYMMQLDPSLWPQDVRLCFLIIAGLIYFVIWSVYLNQKPMK